KAVDQAKKMPAVPPPSPRWGSTHTYLIDYEPATGKPGRQCAKKRQPADHPVATSPNPAYRRFNALPFAVHPLHLQVTTCPAFPAPPSSN
ncbi:hypothetical protein JWR97_25645, partial [Pseudomonas cedrina subsp. fulgida]|nr:hypothetical protein [Pseudomonas cedrina subsp. fulgida]